MTYEGMERRHNKVFVTHNTEYHLRDGVCIAVRDRKTGEWQRTHRALGSTLMGGIEVTPIGTWKVNFGPANVGEKLCFANDLLTSPVENVARPNRSVVDTYPSAARA
jgi:hypothetical protein